MNVQHLLASDPKRLRSLWLLTSKFCANLAISNETMR